MTARPASIAVVANPVAAEAESSAVAELLTARGINVNWIETSEDDPGVGQAKAAVAEGADVVVVCGGDGTVRACIESLAGTNSALAIVPAGTGNLLARNLGIPADPAVALDIALDGKRRQIDVGYANGEAFAVMAGAGLDAAIMRNTDRDAKNRFGVLAYITTALQHLRDRPRKALATVDGGPVFSGSVATMLAANFGELQGGINLAPESDPGDGRLDFVAVSADSLWSWLRTGLGLLFGREPADSVSRWSGPEASVTFRAPTPYELDGEERPATTQLEFSVCQAAVEVCVPEETQ